jgi:4-hydroxyphenylpyruvate dioxygenase
MIPAIRGLEGGLIYLVDRFGKGGSIYDVDFVPEPGDPATSAACGLVRIDHVAQVMPRSEFDGAMLFYRAVFGFDAEPGFELIDPYGLIQSRVVESRERTIRLPLNASQAPNPNIAPDVGKHEAARVFKNTGLRVTGY